MMFDLAYDLSKKTNKNYYLLQMDLRIHPLSITSVTLAPKPIAQVQEVQ
jgi:hypothetical protein